MAWHSYKGGVPHWGWLPATLVNVHLFLTLPPCSASEGGYFPNLLKLGFYPILRPIVATFWTHYQLGKTGWNKEVCLNPYST